MRGSEGIGCLHCLGLLIQGSNGDVGWAMELGVWGNRLDLLIQGSDTGFGVNADQVSGQRC